MSIDYSALRERIRDRALTQKQLASLIGISEGQLCKKMNSEYVFKQTEIIKMCEVLEIEPSEISLYFFTEKVEKHQRIKNPA